MPNWLSLCISAIVLLFGIVHGLLMLLSPAKHRRFNLRVNDPFRRLRSPEEGSDDSRGLELGYRLAGLGVLIMCMLIAWGVSSSLLGYHHGKPISEHTASPTVTAAKDWWGLVASAGFFLLGLCAFLRPLQLYRWTTARALPSSVPPAQPQQIQRGGQLLGICFMTIGLICFFLALKGMM